MYTYPFYSEGWYKRVMPTELSGQLLIIVFLNVGTYIIFYPYDFHFFFFLRSRRKWTPKTETPNQLDFAVYNILISFWTKQFNNNNSIDVWNIYYVLYTLLFESIYSSTTFIIRNDIVLRFPVNYTLTVF